MRTSRLRPHKYSNQRNQQGDFLLIDALVGVLLGSIFAGVVCSSMSQALCLTSGAHNQLIAGCMAQEILDAAREVQFAKLQAYSNNTYPLTLKLTPGVIIPDSPYPRPLLIDQVNYSYGNNPLIGNKAVNNSLNDATCTASETVATNGDGSIQVTVNIIWKDSTGPHTYSASERIAQNGIGG